ncbi:hypothetical protein Afil01_23190 [Actinorhabdospora filicis]|uniref:Uncharacterized protein n=1 Tax=Actinorhabdospora filicis TaxID=1785913 RepID=A0A9W6W2X9_9ACTN|nr:DUF6463 family protein [Actinorhabdospora filicis]GLZ77512.1 hypothetical protein Afil01_23190 [Actinorhabdospora filicis]
MPTPANDTTPKPARRTLWAGWALIAIGAGHSVIGFAISAHVWPGWFTGDLHGTLFHSALSESELAFWSGPGGFPVPLILLGCLTIGRARKGEAMPRYVGWTLAAWAVFCSYIGFPGGFLLFAIPVPLLLLDARRARRAS